MLPEVGAAGGPQNTQFTGSLGERAGWAIQVGAGDLTDYSGEFSWDSAFLVVNALFLLHVAWGEKKAAILADPPTV